LTRWCENIASQVFLVLEMMETSLCTAVAHKHGRLGKPANAAACLTSQLSSRSRVCVDLFETQEATAPRSKAFEAGALGYVTKSSEPGDELVREGGRGVSV